MPEVDLEVLKPIKPKSKLPPKYDHYNKFRRKQEYTWQSVISGCFRDLQGDVTSKVKIKREDTILKFKILAGFFCCGLLGGHTYTAYRGFSRMSLYTQHVLVGGGTGTLCAFPVLSFLNIKNKECPNAYMIARGGIFGSVCGLAHRGSFKYMFPYSILGMSVHGLLLTFWYGLIKPVYYYHILRWPDYIPPKWWPDQPISGMEVYLNELQMERLNVTYPEDLQYFEALDKDKEDKLQKRKAMEFQENFVYHSEIGEKQQLETDPVKPKNMFGI